VKNHDSSVHHDLPLLTNPAVWACALAGALAMSTNAHAAYDDAKQQYEADKTWCTSGQSTEPRALCLKEAARAYSEAKKGTLEPMDNLEPTAAGPTSGKTRHHKHRAKSSTKSTNDSSTSTDTTNNSSGTTTTPNNSSQPQGTTR